MHSNHFVSERIVCIQHKSTEAQFICQQSISFLVLVPSAFLHQVNIYIS